VSAATDRARVAILLSTYNGATYLPALLDGFLAQTHRDWVLLWRDDGSRDETPSLMRNWGAAHPDRFAEVAEPSGNQGVTGSFMTLLRAGQAAGFTAAAFADQDDVWLPDKLEWGLSALAAVPQTQPALYCARQVLVDGALRRIGLSAPLAGPAAFPSSLTQNIATGNTVILNRAAMALVAPTAPPRECWHDWWCYLMVTAAGGRVLRDDRGVILYRQHDANVVGAPTSAAVSPTTRRSSLPTSIVSTSPQPLLASSLSTHSMTALPYRRKERYSRHGVSLTRIFPLPETITLSRVTHQEVLVDALRRFLEADFPQDL